MAIELNIENINKHYTCYTLKNTTRVVICKSCFGYLIFCHLLVPIPSFPQGFLKPRTDFDYQLKNPLDDPYVDMNPDPNSPIMIQSSKMIQTVIDKYKSVKVRDRLQTVIDSYKSVKVIRGSPINCYTSRHVEICKVKRCRLQNVIYKYKSAKVRDRLSRQGPNSDGNPSWNVLDFYNNEFQDWKVLKMKERGGKFLAKILQIDQLSS